MTSELGPGNSLAASIQRSINAYCGIIKGTSTSGVRPLLSPDCPGNEAEAFALGE